MTRLALAALAALTLTACTTTQAHGDAPPPPARFDGPYHGELILSKGTLTAVQRACEGLYKAMGAGTAPNPILGCAARHWPSYGQCTVHVIAKPYPYFNATPAAVLRHELGHCNGWGPNHER